MLSPDESKSSRQRFTLPLDPGTVPAQRFWSEMSTRFETARNTEASQLLVDTQSFQNRGFPLRWENQWEMLEVDSMLEGTSYRLACCKSTVLFGV